MLQRIQTIFLLIAVLAFGSLFYLPFASTETAYENFLADKIYNLMDSPLLIIIVAVGILVSLITIFLYNNRPMQVRLTWISIIIGILIPLVAAAQFYYGTEEIGIQNIELSVRTGIFIPVVIIIALALALRNIKKDEDLVKSMDRLR